jgi:hypothetical protein
VADGDELDSGADVFYRRIQQRGGTRAQIMAVNEIPLVRELVVATDTRDVWVGDGVTPVSELPGMRDGGDGPAGPSAYDVWLAAGNVGGVDDFLASYPGISYDAATGTYTIGTQQVRALSAATKPGPVASQNLGMMTK